jgi:hypothetical protein
MANTVGTKAKVGMLAKVVKQQRAGRQTTAGTVCINIRDRSSSRDNGNIMDVESWQQYIRKDSNIQQGHQQQQQELSTRTL